MPSGVRINHLVRHGAGRRRAEVHAVDLAHLLFEPHRKWIRALAELRERRLRMIAFERDEDQIALGCVLQERPLAHAKAASRRPELGLAGSHQLADKLLPLFGLARWNRKRHRQHCHHNLLDYSATSRPASVLGKTVATDYRTLRIPPQGATDLQSGFMTCSRVNVKPDGM